MRPLTDAGWREASSSFALRSSGQVKTLVGSTPWAGSVWNTSERILLNINPNVTGIKEIFGVVTKITPRVFQGSSLLLSFGSMSDSLFKWKEQQIVQIIYSSRASVDIEHNGKKARFAGDLGSIGFRAFANSMR